MSKKLLGQTVVIGDNIGSRFSIVDSRLFKVHNHPPSCLSVHCSSSPRVFAREPPWEARILLYKLVNRSWTIVRVIRFLNFTNIRPFSDMLLPKGGVTWKSTKARFPPSRAIFHLFSRTRLPLFLILAAIVVILWRGIHTSAREMQRYSSMIPFSTRNPYQSESESDCSLDSTVGVPRSHRCK